MEEIHFVWKRFSSAQGRTILKKYEEETKHEWIGQKLLRCPASVLSTKKFFLIYLFSAEVSDDDCINEIMIRHSQIIFADRISHASIYISHQSYNDVRKEKKKKQSTFNTVDVIFMDGNFFAEHFQVKWNEWIEGF